jgi:hypothetical protein
VQLQLTGGPVEVVEGALRAQHRGADEVLQHPLPGGRIKAQPDEDGHGQ